MMKMTHNEYAEYTKECANRIYTDKNYRMADFNRDVDSVEILPYDLARFGLPEYFEKLINAYFSKETQSRNGHYMLRGFISSTDILYNLASKFEMKVYVDAYHGYCLNDEYMMIMDYTEGDINLLLFENESEYLDEKQETIDFYIKN